jgi:putative endonuclease
MFYVYILLSLKDKKLYTGSTGDLRRRIEEHKQGKVESTKNRLPMDLICYEAYLHKEEALAREQFLKSSDGKKDLRKRLTKSLFT